MDIAVAGPYGHSCSWTKIVFFHDFSYHLGEHSVQYQQPIHFDLEATFGLMSELSSLHASITIPP